MNSFSLTDMIEHSKVTSHKSENMYAILINFFLLNYTIKLRLQLTYEICTGNCDQNIDYADYSYLKKFRKSLSQV